MKFCCSRLLFFIRLSIWAIKCSVANGFSIYASAPESRPSIFALTWTEAVSSMTGIWLNSMVDLICLHSSYPFMTGIITSLTTTMMLNFFNALSASSPLWVRITLYSPDISLAMNLPISTSSSTRSRFGLFSAEELNTSNSSFSAGFAPPSVISAMLIVSSWNFGSSRTNELRSVTEVSR